MVPQLVGDTLLFSPPRYGAELRRYLAGFTGASASTVLRVWKHATPVRGVQAVGASNALAETLTALAGWR